MLVILHDDRFVFQMLVILHDDRCIFQMLVILHDAEPRRSNMIINYRPGEI